MATLSHIVLQRVIVRMLFDHSFARAVAERPDESLKGLGLDARHVSFLTTQDARAWRLDPHRRARALEALLDEFPTASAFVMHTTPDRSLLDAFFSSPNFHECIQQRQRLALAFGNYLMAIADQLERRDIYGLAALERAIAAYRRPIKPPTYGNAELQLGRNVMLVSVPGGSLDTYVSLSQTFASHNLSGAEAVVSPPMTLQPAPTLKNDVFVLLETLEDGSGPALSELDEALGTLLDTVRGGTSVEAFESAARQQGAEPGEEPAILSSLIEDGLIARGSDLSPAGAS